MTNPITPPPELVAKWASSMCGYYEAAQWGSDQELEACCEWLKKNTNCHITIEFLRDARRPKPPSLKEQALEALEAMNVPLGVVTVSRVSIIRRALESLDD